MHHCTRPQRQEGSYRTGLLYQAAGDVGQYRVRCGAPRARSWS